LADAKKFITDCRASLSKDKLAPFAKQGPEAKDNYIMSKHGSLRPLFDDYLAAIYAQTGAESRETWRVRNSGSVEALIDPKVGKVEANMTKLKFAKGSLEQDDQFPVSLREADEEGFSLKLTILGRKGDIYGTPVTIKLSWQRPTDPYVKLIKLVKEKYPYHKFPQSVTMHNDSFFDHVKKSERVFEISQGKFQRGEIKTAKDVIQARQTAWETGLSDHLRTFLDAILDQPLKKS
jgi:hypothetical protein